jgi:outer membrane protein OmpA-like peptidoglycan-associated protein
MPVGRYDNLLWFGFCLFVVGIERASAQVMPGHLSPVPGKVVVTERSDFSRYEDGRYIGHTYRESRLVLDVTPLANRVIQYNGEVLVLEETMRDERALARRIDDYFKVTFDIYPGGAVHYYADDGYPLLRGFPDLPPESVVHGGTWIAEATVVVQPRFEAPHTRIPVLVEYEFTGMTKYAESEAFSVRARYAIRYKGNDPMGDPDLTGANGSRVADILVSQEDGSTLFIRETIDETFTYKTGGTVRFKGFILHFYRGSPAGDRDRIAALLSSSGSPATAITPVPETAPTLASVPSPAVIPTPAYEIEKSGRGVVLLLYDLRFVADGDTLLPAEDARLDAIAEALVLIPDRTFLVEGHTADLGKPAGQYELALRRAKRIVDEMAKRGVPPHRFIYQSLGADKPVAPNDTEINRARNRRVEITILD